MEENLVERVKKKETLFVKTSIAQKIMYVAQR